MTGAPVKCRNCGLVWPSRQFRVEGMGAFEGCTESPCPRCRGIGDVMSGTYVFDRRGTPTLVSGPPETQAVFRKLYGALRDKSVKPEQLQALADVVRASRSGELNEEEAVQAAAAIKPEFGRLWRGQEAGLLAIVLMILIWWHEQQASGRDHAETMAAFERQHQQELRQYEIEGEQLSALRTILAELTAPPPQPITEPPAGHRTKRQQRRDRRFKGNP